jgi:hypothetical protein
MIETIEFKGKVYPKFQSEGGASEFVFPFAKKVLSGFGYDIGCMKEEWAFPGSYPIDIDFNDPYDANNLPEQDPDYIFSSHCLEHIPDWVHTMNYWHERLKENGTLFLYLPEYSQEYWRPWNNRKHVNAFTPQLIKDYMLDVGYKNVFVSGVDLNNSFVAMGDK